MLELPIIRPQLFFVQKAFYVELVSFELSCGGGGGGFDYSTGVLRQKKIGLGAGPIISNL